MCNEHRQTKVNSCCLQAMAISSVHIEASLRCGEWHLLKHSHLVNLIYVCTFFLAGNFVWNFHFPNAVFFLSFLTLKWQKAIFFPFFLSNATCIYWRKRIIFQYVTNFTRLRWCQRDSMDNMAWMVHIWFISFVIIFDVKSFNELTQIGVRKIESIKKYIFLCQWYACSYMDVDFVLLWHTTKLPFKHFKNCYYDNFILDLILVQIF